MSHITKKFRPMKFADVLGQQINVTKLTTALSSGILPPAYLFIGMRGMGKTTCARLITMSLNCEQRVGVEPCGKCGSCMEIIEGSSDYLVEVDGATNNKVEDMRNLTGSVGYYVPEGHYKVVVIDECHSLSKAAWDASLKTIEEPPPRVLFIFCTTDVQKVIATVKSRCTPIQFAGATEATIVEMLKIVLTAENVPFEEPALMAIAKESGGSIRDAQSILEGFIRSGKIETSAVKSIYTAVDANSIITYFNNVLAKDMEASTKVTMGWIRSGHTPDLIMNSLLEHLRNMIMSFIVTDSNLRNMLKAQRDKAGDTRIAQWITFFYDQIKYLKEYPMEFSLVLDLITIRLIDTLSVSTKTIDKKKKEADEKQEEKVVEAAPAVKKADPLNKTLINELKEVCGGLITELTPDYCRVTITNAKGTVFDVVSNTQVIKNKLYILGENLPEVIKGYPQSMSTYCLQKN